MYGCSRGFDRAIFRVAIAAIAAASLGRVALADGAFPDSNGILAPADREHRLFLGTNFGMLISDDDGASWSWICEQAIVAYAYLFQLGPAPTDSLFALGPGGMAISSDSGCTSQNPLEGFLLPNDVFPDPTDSSRVYLLLDERLMMSNDGGYTFPTALFTAAASVTLGSVESAKSDPQTIYLTMSAGNPLRRWIARSTNGGLDFDTFEQTDALGGRSLRIAAVDPVDPRMIYFRVARHEDDPGDFFGISQDGGATVRLALQVEMQMTAFLRREDGTLIVGAVNESFISEDGAMSFSPWNNAPHLRGLAERAGAIYAATDNFVDGYAAAVSFDSGARWHPLLSYSAIGGVAQCGRIPRICEGPWNDLVQQFDITPSLDDGGVERDAGRSEDASVARADGCACDGTGNAGASALAVIFALLLLRPRSTHKKRKH